jgi:hypothetical protein
MYCFLPSAFFTIVCAVCVPGSNLLIIKGGCYFLIVLVFSFTFSRSSFSNFCLNLSGISYMSTSFSNLSSNLNLESPLNVLLISSISLPLSPSSILLSNFIYFGINNFIFISLFITQ